MGATAVIGMGGMFGSAENPLDGLKDLWGGRPYQRRTRGNPARTRALVTLYATALEFDMPQLENIAVYLAEAWAGEEGWDTDALLRGIQAAASARQQTIQMPGQTTVMEKRREAGRR